MQKHTTVYTALSSLEEELDKNILDNNVNKPLLLEKSIEVKGTTFFILVKIVHKAQQLNFFLFYSPSKKAE